MGVGIEFFSFNEKNQGIQIGCPDLLCHVLAEKILDFSLTARKEMFAKEAIAGFSYLFNFSAG